MDIRQLGYFVRVAELGSFSRAAASLQITQPALSKQIQNLEAELQERLLVRNGRGVETTEVGARLFAHARDLLQRMAETYEDINSVKRNKSVRISIGMAAAISPLLATPIVRQLWTNLEGVKVSIMHGRTDQLLDRLLNGQIDMAITFNAPLSSAFEVENVSNEALYLFGAPHLMKAHALAPLEVLASIPMIVGSRSHSVRNLLDAELGRAGLTLNIVLELDAFDSVFDLVREGFGCTVTSMETFRARSGSLAGLVVQPFASPELKLRVDLVKPRRRARNKDIDAAYSIVGRASRETFDSSAPEPGSGIAFEVSKRV